MTSPLMNNVLILKGPEGLRIKLDQREVDLHADSSTAAMVFLHEYKAPFWDIIEHKQLDGPTGRTRGVTMRQYAFLLSISDDLHVFLFNNDADVRAKAAANLTKETSDDY